MSLANVLQSVENQIFSARKLPDVARHQAAELVGRLNWVGMNEIEMPIRWTTQNGETWHIPSRVDAFVSLDDPEAKGIHMSRLFLHLQEGLATTSVTPQLLVQLVGRFLESHKGISQSSYVGIKFDYMTQRLALKSDNLGWRHYPVAVKAVQKGQEIALEMSFKVTYSSTCPCSAALARQLIQEQFRNDFSGDNVSTDRVYEWLGNEGIVATPHSQRSEAEIRVLIDPAVNEFPLLQLIDRIEGALKTPVQAAVKREDEQEFARLNAQNLMFCEDAARKIYHALESDPRVFDFWARASHLESLHPHNAVSIVTKGVSGGFSGDV
jgi:GTP cyclohydrolase I